jgi:hypothetical protein
MTTPDGLPARLPVPPFDEATARQKVHAAEDTWTTRDPQRVAAAYTVTAAYTADSQWRNRSEFVRGRAEIVALPASTTCPSDAPNDASTAHTHQANPTNPSPSSSQRVSS